MKKTIRHFSFALIASLAVCLLTSCGKPKPVLHVYNWGDYIADEVVKQFEKEYDCKIKLDVFDSNEAMYAKIKAGATGYDVVAPSSYMATLMYAQGMLKKLEHDKIPNVIKYLDKSYLDLSLDPKIEFSVPYFVSFTGIGYDSKAVKNFKPSWKMFEDPALKGHCSLLNDHRELIGAALCTLGYSVNSTNQEHLDKALELIRKWKKNIAKFGVDDAKIDLASGAFKMIQTYSGDMLQVSMEKPHIKFVIPVEGSTVTFDNLAIMKNTDKNELAHAFINFIYRPDIAAKNMDAIMYVTPHTEAVKLVNEKLRNNPAFNLPPDVRKRCTMLKDLGEENTKYIRLWDRIREE